MFINNDNSRLCSLCIRKISPTFLEECKYVQEKIKTKNYIDKELKSDSESNDSDTNNNE